MPRTWKKVAEHADIPAFSLEEVGARLRHALAQDWDEIPSSTVRSVERILDQLDDFFDDHRTSSLESLRPSTAGHPLSSLFVDCAIQVVADGEAVPDLAVQAVTTALAVRAARRTAQMEEHYLRESTSRRAQRLRGRLEDGIQGAALEGLARQLLKREAATASRAPSKRRGLDDGVQL